MNAYKCDICKNFFEDEKQNIRTSPPKKMCGHHTLEAKDIYQRGLDDAWEAARKIVLSPDEGGTSLPDLFAMFGNGSMQRVFRNYSASEAIAKLKDYEEKACTEGIMCAHEWCVSDQQCCQPISRDCIHGCGSFSS